MSSGREARMAADGETAAKWPPGIAAGLLVLLVLLVRLSHGPPETDLAVVDPQVESAVGIAADPRLVRDGRAILAVVAERKE
jgi:hypothetical protein